jgi:hypothetical protein
MKWTKSKPKVDGYYWYQAGRKFIPYMIVFDTRYRDIAFVPGGETCSRMNELNGYFYGPVEPPKLKARRVSGEAHPSTVAELT